jgi:hypothetical protein
VILDRLGRCEPAAIVASAALPITAAIVTYAYDQIDQARTALVDVSK